MMKRTHILMIAAVLALSGCMAGSKPREAAPPQQIMVFPQPPDEPRFYYERTLISSADVTPDLSEDKFRRALTGEALGAEGLAKPYGVAVHRGRVFVADTVRRAVVVFDIPGRRYFKIGEDDSGTLSMPLTLAVDKQGDLYVIDVTLKLVMVYNRDGKFLRSIGKAEQFNKPGGIAVDAGGTRVYVVDTGGVGSKEHRVRVFDAQSGAHLFDIGKRGTGPGEFNLPRGAVVAPDGSLYVVDGGNFRVQRFGADGKYISQFGKVGRGGGQFSRPKEVAVDPTGNIYVSDAAFGNFQIFNPDGQLLLAVGNRSAGNTPAGFSLNAGIAADEDGRIYMVDQIYRKVDIFRPAALDADAGFTVKKTEK